MGVKELVLFKRRVFSPDLGSIFDRFGIDVGPILDRFWTDLGLILNRFGILMCLFKDLLCDYFSKGLRPHGWRGRADNMNSIF